MDIKDPVCSWGRLVVLLIVFALVFLACSNEGKTGLIRSTKVVLSADVVEDSGAGVVVSDDSDLAEVVDDFVEVLNDSSSGSDYDPVSEIDMSDNSLEKKVDVEILKKIKDKHDDLRSDLSVETVEVILKSKDVERLKRKIDKKVRRQRRLSDDLISVEVDVDDVNDIASDDDVEKVYANRKYSALLSDSVPLTGASVYWQNNFTGSGIKVAILDTGIDSDHPMLAGKVVAAESFVGGSVEDGNGHGTHCAGIAAGVSGDQGYDGVAPGALLLNAKVLDNYGSGTTESIVAGINWAVDNGADVISMSLGAHYSTPDELIDDALQDAIDHGVVVVIASGNCGPSGSCGGFNGVTVPGNFEPVITVGAVDDDLNWASFSSGEDFGSYVKPDVVSFGVDIMSSVVDGYDVKSGTSMATPMVAGMVALILEENNSLSHYDVKSLLELNAVDLGVEGKDIKYGSGVVDLDFSKVVYETDLDEVDAVFPTEAVLITSTESVNVSNNTGYYSSNVPLQLMSLSDSNPFASASCSGDRLCGGQCWPDCSDSSHPYWVCDKDGNGACCPDTRPYYNPNTDTCFTTPYAFDCSDSKPYLCYDNGMCVDEQIMCEVHEYCGGGYWYCVDYYDIGVCDSNGEYHCCDEDYPYYWESDGKCHTTEPSEDPVCGNGHCEQFEDEFSCSEDCGMPCDNDQCISWRWGYCVDEGDTCCDEDGSENPQYYCNGAHDDWDVCSDDQYNEMSLCEESGADYFCTEENGIRKLRECPLGCSGGSCVDSICGNGYCESQESKQSCPSDCYSDIKIVDFKNPPAEVVEGQSVTIRVTVKNYGSSTDTTKMEVGIIPKDFWSSEFGVASQTSIAKCCGGNEYYAAKEVTLGGGAQEDIVFNLNAPSRDSVDHCNNGVSAWASEFMITTSLYDQCCTSGNCIVQATETVDVNVVTECSSDADCVTENGYGYKCNFAANPNVCEYDPCPDECTDYNQYSCTSGGDVRRCVAQSDGCYDYDVVENCYGGMVCSGGDCVGATKKTEVILEDAARDQLVYKQPGDVLFITLDAHGGESIDFEYDTSVFSGDCPTHISISSDIVCKLYIDEDAAIGSYSLKIPGSNSETVKIINNPYTLVITNRAKLFQRFNDDSGVRNLLKQAYQTAGEDKGVVYNLKDYIGEGPYSSFSSYNPDPFKVDDDVNAYSLAVAQFIDSKCENCRNIMILGDDFVVPHYRVDYADISFWNWFKTWFDTDTLTDYVYTDQPYIKETKKTMGDLGTLFEKDDYEEVIVILPNSVSGSLNSEVNEFKSQLQSVYGYPSGDIKVYSSSDVDCDSYSKLDGGTLIVVGDRDNNNAVKCLPWFDVGSLDSDTFKASIALERNVWGKNKYALVVSGDLVSGLGNLNNMIANPFLIDGSMSSADTLYIHDMSYPPDYPPGLNEIGTHIGGFVLGTCDEGGTAEKVSCSATDFTASLVPPVDIITDVRDLILYCPTYIWNKAIGKKGELFDGLICGGSAVGTGVTVGKYVTAVSVVGAVAGESGDVATTIYKRLLKAAKSIFKEESGRFIKFLDNLKLFKFENLKVFFKLDSWTDVGGLKNGWKALSATMNDHKIALRIINKEIGSDDLAQAIKTADELKHVARGVEQVGSEGTILRNYLSNLPDGFRVKLLKKTGKYADEALQKGWVVLKSDSTLLFRGTDFESGMKVITEQQARTIFEKGFKAKDVSKRSIVDHILWNEDGAFIGSSKSMDRAKRFASGPEGGWIFEINPRARNGIDAEQTFELSMFRNQATDAQMDVIRYEREVSFLDDIFPEDIKGAWKVDASGTIVSGSYITNTQYLG